MRPIPLLLASTVALVAAAPAAAQTPASESAVVGAPADARPQKPKVRNSRSEITREEIEQAASARNAYELVRNLRPSWLRTHGAVSMRLAEYTRVYQDGVPVGPIAALSQIPIDAVAAVSYLDGIQATQRFGTGHGGGAILVRTGR